MQGTKGKESYKRDKEISKQCHIITDGGSIS